MNPLERPYIVGLTKFIIVQSCIVQNYKNPNTKVFIYKYLYLLML
jgi:hypothetical protein